MTFDKPTISADVGAVGPTKVLVRGGGGGGLAPTAPGAPVVVAPSVSPTGLYGGGVGGAPTATPTAVDGGGRGGGRDGHDDRHSHAPTGGPVAGEFFEEECSVLSMQSKSKQRPTSIGRL